MKRKLVVNSIYVTVFAVLLALLLWYGAGTSFSFPIDLQGGEVMSQEAGGNAPLFDFDIEMFPAYQGEQNPEIPAKPVPALPDELAIGAVYQYDTICAIFDSDCSLRIYRADESLSVNCSFLVLSNTILTADYQGDIFSIMVTYRAVRIDSVKLMELFGIVNPISPNILELSLRK